MMAHDLTKADTDKFTEVDQFCSGTSGAHQCPLFGVERCPLLGGSKCISSMVKSIGGK